MLITLLIKAHYTAKPFKQQGELQGMDENVLLPTSLKNYQSNKKQSGKLSEANGTLLKVTDGVR